ncbi:MAG: PilZ domain-containing protein [Deltaproteobacteria bacterium]|nr:PilZ domain-containing protein [Deltaproteobacteria bacterium]
MAGFMNSLRRVFKGRQHPRYLVKDGTFLIIRSAGENGEEQKVQLLDISEGGMAFIYQGSPAELEKSGMLKLLSGRPHGEKIEFETVSDLPLPGVADLANTLRLRGVKFKWMGLFEQAQLKDLIDTVKVCEK